MPDSLTLIIVCLTFLVAGSVKGVIGLGLPSVSLALLTATIGLSQAMALLLVPSLVTNFWQAIVGGNGVRLLKRLWPFFACATFTVWLGALALERVNVNYLSALLGVLLAGYSVISLLGVRLQLSPRQETMNGPVFGVINGVLTGMTGSFVVPGVLFLQAVGLNRDALVQAMGILFTLSTVALGLALHNASLLTRDLGLLSIIGLVPAIIGMWAGQHLRQRLSESMFRRLFFSALLLLGAYIVFRSLVY